MSGPSRRICDFVPLAVLSFVSLTRLMAADSPQFSTVEQGESARTLPSCHKKPEREQFVVIQTGPKLTDVVVLSPDGSQVCGTQQEGLLRLWDAETGRPIRTLAGDQPPAKPDPDLPEGMYEPKSHRDEDVPIYAMAYSPDGSKVAVGGMSTNFIVDDEPLGYYDGGEVRIWDVASGRQVASFDGHSRDVFALAFGADGRTLTAIDLTYFLIVRRVDDGREVTSFRTQDLRAGFGGSQEITAFSDDARRVVTIIPDDLSNSRWTPFTMKLWTLGESPRWLRVMDQSAILGDAKWSCFDLSPDGRRILVGGSDQVIRLMDFDTAETLRTFDVPGDVELDYLAFTPGGRQFISVDEQGFVRLWHVDDDAPILLGQGPGTPVRDAVFLPGRLRLASGGLELYPPGGKQKRFVPLEVWDVDLPATFERDEARN